MLSSIVVDDEPESLRSLGQLIEEECPEVDILALCDNSKEAIIEIRKKQPDILFLDIDMPYINGFELLEMVPDVDFEVIFTTAHDEYALKAFRISAIDYLLKPIDTDELKQAVEKVRIFREKGHASRQIHFLIQQIRDLENNNVQQIALPTFDGLEIIPMENIIYCASDGAYSHVYFSDDSELFISKTLKYLEDALGSFHFFRVHRSYIVNLNKIKKYVKTDGGLVIMSNGKELPVSRSRKDELLNLF